MVTRSWSSEVGEAARLSIERDMRCEDPGFQILFATPEALATDRLRLALKDAYAAGTIRALVVDEAHCASQWYVYRAGTMHSPRSFFLYGFKTLFFLKFKLQLDDRLMKASSLYCVHTYA